MKSLLLRLWINKECITRETFKIVGFIYTILGVIVFFQPIEKFIDCDTSGRMRLLYGVLLLLVVSIVMFIWASTVCLRSKCVCVLNSNSDSHVYVKFGDIYNPDVVGKGHKNRINLVVPANRCFDTDVDDQLISLNTVHGEIMQGLYDSNIFSRQSLNDALQESLVHETEFDDLEMDEKPKGNRRRYASGTIAEVKINDNLTYFFLGLSKFNSQLTATTTKSEYVKAIQKMIEYCNAHSQGYPVALPLMGSGLSRTNIPPEDNLNYLLNAFKINMDIINCDYYVVLDNKMKDKVSIKNL